MNGRAVLKALGVRELNNKPVHTDIKIVGCINGFFIYPVSYYWVVKGKMPLKYADELYKYSDDLDIRVAGGANNNKPIDWCTSDEFEDYKAQQTEQFELIGMDKFVKNLETERKKLFAEKPESFYVEMYHIDNLEGLKKVVDIIKEFNIKTEW